MASESVPDFDKCCLDSLQAAYTVRNAIEAYAKSLEKLNEATSAAVEPERREEVRDFLFDDLSRIRVGVRDLGDLTTKTTAKLRRVDTPTE